MPSTMSGRTGETPQQKLSAIHGATVKANLDPKAAETVLRVLAKDTIQRVGKQSAAAVDIGISEGRLSAKLGNGTLSLAELERLGPMFAAEYGRLLLERFGPLATPKARASQKLREIRAAVDEVEQAVEHIS